MLLPARRPHPGSAGRTVPLQSNFYHFQHTQQEVIYKYSLKFEPELPAQITRLRERIFRKAIASSSISARFVCSNTLLFSFHSTDQEILQVTYDDVLYTLTITAAGIADSAFDSRAFYNKFFNSVQGRLNLSMIGRKFFSMSEQDSIELPHKRIKILSGYSTSVQSLAGGCMVNIDLAHRCLSTVTVLEQLEELRGPDYVSRVKSLLIGSSVITRYNNKLYRVDDVDFDSRPDSVFTDSKGASQTFHEYFRKRWHVELSKSQNLFMK